MKFPVPLPPTLFFSLLTLLVGCNSLQETANAAPPVKSSGTSGWQSLSSEEARIVEACGTEAPFSGKYVNHKEDGTYTCTRCGSPLFASGTKFDSKSGWPAFDDTVSNAVREIPDPDGMRTEIRCARCDGHLGHVFRGERFTANNTRHCVNSLSLDFVSEPMEEAYFAGGCFWGVEALLEEAPGVNRVESGYMGGTKRNPGYREVTTGRTGHAEVVRVLYNPEKTPFETLAKLFFEIHDPTQVNRQGPDIGNQYRSAVFYGNETQKEVTEKLIGILRAKGFSIATTVEPAQEFWPAEDYHQDYYKRTGKAPYCHSYEPRF
jgi:peptide methionine sulfoxide reductase msrA/msrB